MKITISDVVAEELKAALAQEGKTAARFIVSDFGCKGPLFDIELSEAQAGDITEHSKGIDFVVEGELAIAIEAPEVIKKGNEFSVKRSACGC